MTGAEAAAAASPAWQIWAAVVGAVATVALSTVVTIMVAQTRRYQVQLAESIKEAHAKADEAARVAAETRLKVAEGYVTKDDLGRVQEQVACKVDKGDFIRFATAVEKTLDEIGRDIKGLYQRLPAPGDR